MEFLVLSALFCFISLVCAIPAVVNRNPISPALVERQGSVDGFACSIYKLSGLCAKDKDSCNAVSFGNGCGGKSCPQVSTIICLSFFLSFFWGDRDGDGGESGVANQIPGRERDRVMLRSASKLCQIHPLFVPEYG